MKSASYWHDHLNSAKEELDSMIEILDDDQVSKKDLFIFKKYTRTVFCNLLKMLYKSSKYVMMEQGCDIAISSPKGVFRQLNNQGFITSSEFEVLNEAVDLRNQIVHEYDMFLNVEADLGCLFRIRDDLEKIVIDILGTLEELKEYE